MAREIERKFLVRTEYWRPDEARGLRIRQGYLSSDPARVVRVRTVGPDGFLTVKGRNRGIERSEFEYPIPRPDADAMLDALCERPLVEKVRYTEQVGEHVWEIDVFEGDNAGLVIAEVELADATVVPQLPVWAGEDVSADPRYFNSNLIRHPYSRWSATSDVGHD